MSADQLQFGKQHIASQKCKSTLPKIPNLPAPIEIKFKRYKSKRGFYVTWVFDDAKISKYLKKKYLLRPYIGKKDSPLTKEYMPYIHMMHYKRTIKKDGSRLFSIKVDFECSTVSQGYDVGLAFCNMRKNYAGAVGGRYSVTRALGDLGEITNFTGAFDSNEQSIKLTWKFQNHMAVLRGSKFINNYLQKKRS